jgi:hypothetical protein
MSEVKRTREANARRVDQGAIEATLHRDEWPSVLRILRAPDRDPADVQAPFVDRVNEAFARAMSTLSWRDRDPNAVRIAIANAALPDSDARRITHEDVNMLRITSRQLREAGMDSAEGIEALANALASNLPPE